jgi:hypothetical protein
MARRGGTRWPEEEAPDGEDGEPGHEGYAQAVFSEDLARDSEWAEEVGAKVGGGET